jgi:hypothetical protein
MIVLGTCPCIAVFRELGVRHGRQRRVVVLSVHSYYYSRWYIASTVVHQILCHINYRLAVDHLGPYVFVSVRSTNDAEILASYRRFEFPHRIRFLTIRPNDPEIHCVRAVHAVPLN